MDLEQSKTKKVAAVSIIVFLGLAFSDGYIAVHEAGHWTSCTALNGDPEFEMSDQGPSVHCLDIPEWSNGGYALFYGSGILAELGLAAVLLVSPYTRFLAGLTVFKITGTYVFTSGYSHDLSMLAQTLGEVKI